MATEEIQIICDICKENKFMEFPKGYGKSTFALEYMWHKSGQCKK